MEIYEHTEPGTQELHVHTVLTAIEMRDAIYNLKDVIFDRIAREMVREQLPLVRANIKIDWARVQKEVEDALIQRMVGRL
jgi:hypothetical protein